MCVHININYLAESYRKLNYILQSFNLSSIVNFPTRIGPNPFSTIDNFLIDNSNLNKFDIILLINGFSDHDAQLLTVRFAQKHNKDQYMYFEI